MNTSTKRLYIFWLFILLFQIFLAPIPLQRASNDFGCIVFGLYSNDRRILIGVLVIFSSLSLFFFSSSFANCQICVFLWMCFFSPS